MKCYLNGQRRSLEEHRQIEAAVTEAGSNPTRIV